MKYGIFFMMTSLMLATLAVIHGGWKLLLLWPALSFAILAVGYFGVGPAIYGKSTQGLLSPFAQILLFPHLFFLWLLWHSIRALKRETAVDQLTDNVFISRRLLSRELPAHIDHIIDLTCEFNEPLALRKGSYYSYPILDGSAPTPSQLRRWVLQVSRLKGNVLIHCAEGHGRSGLFAATLLVATGRVGTPSEALELIRSKRPLVRLERHQIRVMNKSLAKDDTTNHDPL